MAKRFNFRLETVLKLRKQNEEKKQRALAERLREMSTLQDHLMGLNSQIASERRVAGSFAVHAHLDVPAMSKRRFWVSHLQRGVLDTESQIRKLEESVLEDRHALAEAAQEFKIVETLRSKQQQEHDQMQARQETIEADEIALQYHTHRQRETD